MIVIGSYLLYLSIFVIFNGFFVFSDLTGKPKWLNKYKIQERKNIQQINRKAYFKIFKLVAFNDIFGSFLVCFVFGNILSWRNVSTEKELPTIPQLLLYLLVSICLEEIGFYYIHRILHHPYLYTRIHKIHHEITVPFSITQIYCHPLEHIFLNCVPITFGSFLLGNNCGNHLISLWIWSVIMKGSSAIVHSGYHLPFFVSSEEHDFHHSRFNQNYGTIGLLDYIHGTNTAFLQNIAYKRHFVLTGLASAKEVVPECKGEEISKKAS